MASIRRTSDGRMSRVAPHHSTNIPPTNYGAHGGMRLLNAIQAQIDQFLRTGGDVQNFCTGACDPE